MRIAGALLVIAIVFAGWLYANLQPPTPVEHDSSSFRLTNVTVIEPMLARESRANLKIDGGALTRVGGSERHPTPYPELSGTYVLPGLIDMHAHLPPETALKLTGYFAFLFLSHGVTTIRDAGDPDGTAVNAARTGIANGDFPGPRIYSCGPFVAGGEPRRWPNTLMVDKPGDAEGIAVAIKQAGHTCIKVYEDLSVEKIVALKEAGERHGLQVIGHTPAQLSYEEALVPDVQHFFGVPPAGSLGRDHVLNRTADWHAVDEARMGLIVQTSLAHDMINTPTLVSTKRLLFFADRDAALKDPAVLLMPRLYPEVVWHPTDGVPYWSGAKDYAPRIASALERKLSLVGKLHRAGAKLQLGTDSQQPFVVPGAALHEEMSLFVEAGVPLEEVWALATWKQGDRLMKGLDRLTSGAPADFLIFSEDPTLDLRALDSLVAVVAQGRLYRRAEIDAAQERYLDHFRGRLVDTVSLPIARRTVKQSVLRDY